MDARMESEEMAAEKAREFDTLLTEYRECGQLFRDGMRIIMEIVRTFIYFNAILLTAVALVLRASGTVAGSIFVLALSVLGAVGCAGTLVTHLRMTRYFRGWLARANALSDHPGFDVYRTTYNVEITGRTSVKQSYWLMIATYALAFCFWVFVLCATIGLTSFNSVNLASDSSRATEFAESQ